MMILCVCFKVLCSLSHSWKCLRQASNVVCAVVCRDMLCCGGAAPTAAAEPGKTLPCLVKFSLLPRFVIH